MLTAAALILLTLSVAADLFDARFSAARTSTGVLSPLSTRTRVRVASAVALLVGTVLLIVAGEVGISLAVYALVAGMDLAIALAAIRGDLNGRDEDGDGSWVPDYPPTLDEGLTGPGAGRR